MKSYLFVFAFALLFCSCDELLLGEEDQLIPLEENLAPPPVLNDGLDVGSMSDAAVDEVKLRFLITSLQSSTRNIHSVLIVKDGKLILESYFGGWHRKRLQSLRSCSKSVTSALIGIAIDKGYLESENEKVFDVFSEYTDLRSNGKEQIEIRHLMMMSAGLRWDQTHLPEDDPRNDERRLEESDDGFRYTLEQPVVSAPGTMFNYSSGNSDLLAGVVHHVTGEYADDFAEKNLFAPLQIDGWGWKKNRNGHPNAGYGVYLYPRDMIKFGKLFLDSGYWKGNQVISKEWIKRSTGRSINVSNDALVGYGYQWWVRTWQLQTGTIRTYQAQGNGGQIICVVPEKDAVIVLTGANYGQAGNLAYSFLANNILPALQ
jgi:CubicO group peptidase (beta-lactamase class C family)